MPQTREELLAKKRAYAQRVRQGLTREEKHRLNAAARAAYQANLEISRQKNREKMRERYWANVEETRERRKIEARVYYAKNAERLGAINRASREKAKAEDPAGFAERRKRYQETYLKRHQDARRETIRAYYAKNRDACVRRCSAWQMHKRATDPEFKLKTHLRNRLVQVLASAKYDPTTQEARDVLAWFSWLKERGVADWSEPGMTIDHVVPISRFNLRNPEAVVVANRWQNLFPLSKSENSRKHKKLVPDYIRRVRQLAEEFSDERRSQGLA